MELDISPSNMFVAKHEHWVQHLLRPSLDVVISPTHQINGAFGRGRTCFEGKRDGSQVRQGCSYKSNVQPLQSAPRQQCILCQVAHYSEPADLIRSQGQEPNGKTLKQQCHQHRTRSLDNSAFHFTIFQGLRVSGNHQVLRRTNSIFNGSSFRWYQGILLNCEVGLNAARHLHTRRRFLSKERGLVTITLGGGWWRGSVIQLPPTKNTSLFVLECQKTLENVVKFQLEFIGLIRCR
jgi:hypothetical protein